VTETSTELAAPAQLLDVQSGELLPATTENAARVLTAAREMKDRVQGVIRDTTAWLAEEARREGKKTFHVGGGKIELSGGTSISYDPEKLREALMAADCPEKRINDVIVETVTYTVNRNELRQLVGANPDYKAAAELAEIREEKAFSASVKR
jgi:hypothetical protein